MQATSFASVFSGLSVSALFAVNPPLVTIVRDGAGVVTYPVWNVPNVTPPTAAEIAAALLAPEPASILAITLMARASAACTALTTAIIPDATHQNAYNIAMAVLVQTGGVAPTSGPFEASFNALATAQGFATPAAFATAAMAVSNGGLNLSTALATLGTAAAAATDASDLANDLTAFETALAAVAAAVTAAGVPVSAPPAIVIPGINA